MQSGCLFLDAPGASGHPYALPGLLGAKAFRKGIESWSSKFMSDFYQDSSQVMLFLKAWHWVAVSWWHTWDTGPRSVGPGASVTAPAIPLLQVFLRTEHQCLQTVTYLRLQQNYSSKTHRLTSEKASELEHAQIIPPSGLRWESCSNILFGHGHMMWLKREGITGF